MSISPSERREQLFNLLPALYRALDDAYSPEGDAGPLRELLSVIGEQVVLLEDDLERMADNWFIETCEDWVVPFIADLVGYQSAVKELNSEDDPESPLNRAVVLPRLEVADTVALRRRKGTLALLEELSRRIVGWPARAIEFRENVAGTAALNYLSTRRSSTIDIRRVGLMEDAGSPFDRLARALDLRRVDSARTVSRSNVTGVGLFVYRRKVDSSTLAPTRAVGGPERRTLDVQGFDVPLHIAPQMEARDDTIAEQIQLPALLTRRILSAGSSGGASSAYYGLDKSVAVIVEQDSARRLVPAHHIKVMNLGGWRYEPTYEERHIVGLDPERGRLAFHPDYAPDCVWTVYHYGRAAELGGGEYERWLEGEPTAPIVDSLNGAELSDALMHYAEHAQAQAHSIIEIADNEEHSAEFTIDVPEGSTLELRAANRFRPYLRVPDRLGQAVERCRFHGARGSRLILDGLLFGDGEVLIEGEFDVVEIRHCTLSPGRTRLVLQANDTRVQIKRSIVGSIVTRVPKRDRTQSDARKHAPAYNEPIHLSIENSIIDGSYDGSRCDHPVLSGANRWAHVRLSADRSTIFGAADVHAVGLIQNSLFVDCLCVENTQAGCLRFSYVAPGSCTPPQFRCQPAQAVERLSSAAQDLSATFESERQRVKPQFLNRRYPHPDYARLVDDCAAEIARGAEDEGEMGAYHDEYFAQRATHLRRRIEEFVPAGFDATVLFET